MTLSDRVAAGASLLDRERPGWWEEIDTDQLFMWSECGCVLGQLEGNYLRGVMALRPAGSGVWTEWSTAHGFELPDIRESWPTLDRLWLAAIAERREAA